MLVYLVVYDFGQVSLEHLLLSWYPSRRGTDTESIPWDALVQQMAYRGTSLIRKRTPLGPYRRPMPRILGRSRGGGHFLMGEVSLYVI